MCLQRARDFKYERSVLGFSFACGLRPHAKLNPKTPLARVSKVQETSRYARSVLGFSFACGLQPHAKINPRTPLACAFIAHWLSRNTARRRTPSFWYDRSVLGFSFACGLRPHAKLNPRTPLACGFKVQQSSQSKRTTPRHRPSMYAGFNKKLLS